ncbi:MAG: hypothetical protein KDE58_03355, partial [Caldilineaceae bacterium]|nr:hypothetical protein [Caldilineaceae bacterium]
SVSAMLSGQSAPLATHWFWLLIGVALLIGGTIFARRNAKPGWVTVALYTLLPFAILFGVTLTVTPLYHVRYLMLYAPLFVLWVAAALTGFYQHNRGVALLLALLLVAVNGWSLHSFWSAPQFQSDDHRGAVSRLAEEWRPGDLILVNAGWAYTAIETYWPKVLIGADAALPPPIANVTRLSDYAQHAGKTKKPASAPLLVRTGSVDGPPSLGWGDPTSDFFAIDRTTTLTALETLSRAHTRIWHYLLYDTVNDPAGLIRQWLADHADLVQDEPITGRDYGRLQLYEVHNAGAANHAAPAANTSLSSTLPITASTTQRGDRQLLAAKPLSTTIPAGQTLYVRTRWQRVDGAPPTADTVSLSLRLYDDRGLLIAQQDSTPRWMSDERTANTMVDLTLALPLPVATQPGSYSLRLLLYEAATGQPLPDHTNESADPLIPLTVI